MEEDIARPEAVGEDAFWEGSVRPERLGDYIGQQRVKENLSVFIEAAAARHEPLDHILFYGPPGLGKTTLAYIVSREMGGQLKTTSGPVLERQGDLAAILTNLEANDVLFIDEIHRLARPIEEILYPAMEDFKLDIMLGKGPGAQSVKIDLPRFTLVGATTRAGSLSAPLRDRFGWLMHLDFYEVDDLLQIILRAAKLKGIRCTEDGCIEIARRARGTPRVALRLLNRVRDFAQVADGAVDGKMARAALDRLEVDDQGLDKMDQRILLTIMDTFGGGPVGLETLSAAIGEEKETIEHTIEPFLLQRGFLTRTPRGRVATERTYRHFGRLPPKTQGGLFS
jgi:holliday junction DNA helicase RuvB